MAIRLAFLQKDFIGSTGIGKLWLIYSLGYETVQMASGALTSAPAACLATVPANRLRKKC